MADPLTLAHRQAQLQIRAATLQDFLRIWPAFDLTRIRATWDPVEVALVALIQARGRTSAGIASRYYRLHREAFGVAGRPPSPRATPTVAEITSGLRVTGPVNAANGLKRGRAASAVGAATFVTLSNAVGMYVLDYGRDTLMNQVHDDRKALGFARQTSGDPCAFCAMLAGRGPVYRSEQSASFEAHRGCSCFPVPQWTRDQAWPDGAEGYGRMWARTTHGLSGKDALNAFRHALSA